MKNFTFFASFYLVLLKEANEQNLTLSELLWSSCIRLRGSLNQIN